MQSDLLTPYLSRGEVHPHQVDEVLESLLGEVVLIEISYMAKGFRGRRSSESWHGRKDARDACGHL